MQFFPSFYKRILFCTVITLLLFLTTLHAQIPTDSLAAYYPFDGNANDESGNGYNATFISATPTTDRFGVESSAYSFNGIDNYIDFGDILDDIFCKDTAQFSISGWAKTTVMGNVYGEGNLIIGKTAGGSGPYQWSISHNSGMLFGSVFSDSTVNNYQQKYMPMGENEWFHFVLIFDGKQSVENRIRVFVNNTSDIRYWSGSGILGTSTKNTSLHMYVGGQTHYFPTLQSRYNGILDDIRIYNRVLSVEEINRLYHEGGWDMTNHAPIANAGPDQRIDISAPVTLNGSASSDPDGDVLTYSWKIAGSLPGGNGGSGIVIVKHPTSFSATGGTITYTGDSTIHTFTSNGFFSCMGTNDVDVLVVAGGGGGGCHTAGGGGAGGVIYVPSYSATGNISVIIGSGGSGSTDNRISGFNGSNSVFGSIIALGGGGGASRFTYAGSGGSGGGGSPQNMGNSNGSGTSGQGYAGGVGGIAWNYLCGGGGGAGSNGSGGTGSDGNGSGGVGVAYSISGSSVYYAGGGGGGVWGTDLAGTGGIGGGGAGSNAYAGACNGIANTGGGGGGGGLSYNTGNIALGTGAQITVSLPAGVHTIILTIDDNKGGISSDSVIVTVGQPIRSPGASIRVSSSRLSFGSVSVGSSKSEYLKIYNYGTDSSLVISKITSSDAAFTVNQTSLTIAASKCDSILISFLPTKKSTIFNDSLILISNDVEKPNVKVTLTGSSTFSQPKVAFTLNVGGPINAAISVLGDNAMYAIASGDAVYRMNTAGSVAYTLQVAGDIRSSSSIAYDTTVYIASSDLNLYAFSKDGNSVWSLPTGGVLTATPVVDSIANRLYIGVSNHNFIAVNRSTGKVDWNYFADGEIRNSAVVSSDRKLIFGSEKGTLYGFDLNNLTLPATPTWQIALPDTALSSIALDNQGYIYIGTSTGRLLKISMPANQQSSIVWQVQLGGAIIGSPVIDATGTLYVGSLDVNLYAVDIQSGAVKWTFSTEGAIRSTPAISNAGNIYVANDNGEVISLDANKNILWYYKTSSAIAAPLLYYKSTLFIGTLGNQIIALYDGADSSQTLPLPKSYASHQNVGNPVWATFQGNNQRTGIFSSSGTTGIKNSNGRIPTAYTLMQNYPNPFNPATTIQFALPKDGRVSIKIFNMLGKHIATLIDAYQYAGYHEVMFNTESFSSGIYFYQMTAGSFVQTKKMLLIK